MYFHGSSAKNAMSASAMLWLPLRLQWDSAQALPPPCVLSCVHLIATPSTVPTRLLCPWNFLGKNAGVGCHFLPQPRGWTCTSGFSGQVFTTEQPGKPFLLQKVYVRYLSAVLDPKLFISVLWWNQTVSPQCITFHLETKEAGNPDSLFLLLILFFKMPIIILPYYSFWEITAGQKSWKFCHHVRARGNGTCLMYRHLGKCLLPF